eukprot:3841909-Pleurochrysis_carterae.AAC.1
MQHGAAGRTHGLFILPKPPGRLHFSKLLKELRKEKVLKGHIDYEFLDKHGAPLDEELYNRWVLPVHDQRLNENARLMRVFDAALDMAKRWYVKPALSLPSPLCSFLFILLTAALLAHSSRIYELKVGDHGPLRMKPTEHDLQQSENNLLFICDIGDGPSAAMHGA